MNTGTKSSKTEPLSAESLTNAAKLLGIGTDASLYDIRAHYHEELKKHHPDTSSLHPEDAHEMTILLNDAYRLLEQYCMNYKFSFRKEDLSRHIDDDPMAEWMNRYGKDPIWS